ncbi:hypothetical protein TNCV_1124121 [Trichonephila clavipes]|uniref:Uncharacterized protein n=1 Tax=Trichonephila clavipes TaxID=2585209 RepID=A0A8X6SGQ6_TRICX|nr:hypothetical protein TNCV_1124121 [Trichonephila clavipes]
MATQLNGYGGGGVEREQKAKRRKTVRRGHRVGKSKEKRGVRKKREWVGETERIGNKFEIAQRSESWGPKSAGRGKSRDNRKTKRSSIFD